MIRVKEGVRFEMLRPEIYGIFNVIDELWQANNSEAMITSAADGVHKNNSKHYNGYALDLRSWNLHDPASIAKALQDMLGADYYVLLESDHIHCQYNPPKEQQ